MMKLHRLTPVVSLISSAESAEALTLLRSSSYGGSVRRIHPRAHTRGLLRRRITERRIHMKRLMLVVLTALFYLGWFAHPSDAQAPRKVKMTIPVVAHSMTPGYVAQSKGFF